MIYIFFTLAFSLVVAVASAQQAPIMVCNAAGTSCTPFTNLDTAIVSASPGSYVYIPGGSFPITAHIAKELHLIGAGHYPDSTIITGTTQITYNPVYFDEGSENSSIEGLYIENWIHGNDTIENISVTRCNISYLAQTLKGCFITNSIVRGGISKCLNSTIDNCIIGGHLGEINYCQINNCIIFGTFNSMFGVGGSYNHYNVTRNSIFTVMHSSTSYVLCLGCSFINNVTTYSGLSMTGATFEVGTISDIPLSNLFVNSTTAGFSYTKDFHLKTTSPGHNAGTDGTDVGIYGGSMPYTDGAVPGNPHFFFKNVGGTTNSSGSLPVHFKVRKGQ